jgi:prevent-host-death family protein
MRTVAAQEAKAHLAQLIDEVTQGERVTITRNGAPVALLVPVPVPSLQKPDAREIIHRLREHRRGITLGGLSIREMIDEGRHG